jgi:hypothetical protein
MWWLPPSPGYGEFYESMFAYGSFVHQKCSNYALTNLLFGLCKYVWVLTCLSLFLVILLNPYPKAPTCPSTPKVSRTRERTPTFHFFVVFTLNPHLSPLRSLGVHHNKSHDGLVWHVINSKAWVHINCTWFEFIVDLQNLWLGFMLDGINPFGN